MGITTGPDGALWFTNYTQNKIGRITTTGTITEFTIPSTMPDGVTSGPTGITAGPDGALWFTEKNTHKIGRITTTGVITEVLTPTPQSLPVSITVGPGQQLWFTEMWANQIGQLILGSEVAVKVVYLPLTLKP